MSFQTTQPACSPCCCLDFNDIFTLDFLFFDLFLLRFVFFRGSRFGRKTRRSLLNTNKTITTRNIVGHSGGRMMIWAVLQPNELFWFGFSSIISENN